MTASLGGGGARLAPELHATLCGLVDESRRRNQTTMNGIRGDDGVQIGQAKAPDRELAVLQRWGLVDAHDDANGVSKTVTIHQAAFDMCPAGA